LERHFDVIVIGGGQSGLAAGYYLRRSGLSFVILDREQSAGGSWQHHWNSLRLFSPAQWSSLPGIIMSGGSQYYPSRDETIQYLKDYEAKYQLPVLRPIDVYAVTKLSERFQITTSVGAFHSKAVVSATGSFSNPVVPEVRGMDSFRGQILHSSQYQSPESFRGKRVAVVGEGNSGAQILAEVSQVTDSIWITQKEPRFLPDYVDGRYLFDAATQMYEAKKQGTSYQAPSLGDIVMVPPVKEARDRGVYERHLRPFQQFDADALLWDDGHREKVDVVIFCTGFKPALHHLSPLNVITNDGRVNTEETKAAELPGLWVVGCGNWTGFASATLIGVGRSARKTVSEIQTYLGQTAVTRS
jgi:putative flavoprotein involved in K+ transport